MQSAVAATVEAYLQRAGYTETLAALRKEASIDTSLTDDAYPNLEELVQDWLDTKEQATQDASKAAELLQSLSLNGKPLQLPSFGRMQRTLQNHNTNILSVTTHVLLKETFDTSKADYVGSKTLCIVTTDAAKNIIFTRVDTGEIEDIFNPHASVVLFVCFHPLRSHIMISCAMDGSILVTNLRTRECIQTIKDHQKYVVRAALSPDGEYMATISYDKSLHLYQSTQDQYIKIHTLRFATNPETVLFLPDSSALLYTRREDNHLHYIALPFLEATAINLNERQDAHISFSILHLTLHPANFLSLQTDQNPSQIILLPFHSHQRIRTLYTQSSQSIYSTPRHQWSSDGQHCIINSDEGLVHAVDLQGTTVGSWKAHGVAAMSEEDLKASDEVRRLWEKERGSANVRDVTCFEKDGKVHVVSVGFDKRIGIAE